MIPDFVVDGRGLWGKKEGYKVKEREREGGDYETTKYFRL